MSFSLAHTQTHTHVRQRERERVLLTPAAEEFLAHLEGIGNWYLGKTEGHNRGMESPVPWLPEAMARASNKMKGEEQQSLIKACNPTQASPLQLQLSYARIAMEEGVAAMEARAIELKRNKQGSQNRLSGLAAAGAEGWLYFWDVIDTRFSESIEKQLINTYIAALHVAV